jgi:hypothetical protein
LPKLKTPPSALASQYPVAGLRTDCKGQLHRDRSVGRGGTAHLSSTMEVAAASTATGLDPTLPALSMLSAARGSVVSVRPAGPSKLPAFRSVVPPESGERK